VPYAAHGYGSFFTFATMDRHYREGMSLEEAQALLQMCIDEVGLPWPPPPCRHAATFG
jgi:20S proteasome subunit beta 4